MHTCIVCLGSNYNTKGNLAFARIRLKELFPSICFAPELQTEPLGLHNPAFFSNQLAQFTTQEDLSAVICFLKEIEQKVGRRPEDKAKEKVVMDLDLLMYDDTVLKPDDMKRAYVVDGFRQLCDVSL
ncbi:2-amino-4-hydroxy-6-hydroxymethyldihydropteridine diphosphokinase [Bacteroides ihuae]|uniref:2-amino-4-hydroxy-6- hydroxymethyldihydropteridine diphosphokinase n=1 Tax=Bacteroides ihuae TaxID=1852362 RepID=UPI0008DA3AD4|nr:2-amino-4-hydroxy-6-hydroxymethyldihydropteridine diphosphokinase [Bacteroides ihuae]